MSAVPNVMPFCGASQTPPASPKFGQRKPLYSHNPKPYLLSLDFDQTMIRWLKGDDKAFDELALRRNVDAIRASYPISAVHVNTGRGLHSFQKVAGVASPFLARMPLDYLSLDNGRELYVNKRHERADKWIARLRTTDAERSWQEKIGWKPAIVNDAIRRLALEAGYVQVGTTANANMNMTTYTRTGNGLTWTLQALDNPSAFLIYAEAAGEKNQVFDEPQRAHGRRLAEHLLGQLASLGIEARYGLEEKHAGDQNYGYFVFAPANVDKGAAIRELLDHYFSKPQAVITAGDSSYNDTPALAPLAYDGKKPEQPVLNYPIVLGQDDVLAKAVQDNPRHEISTESRLDQAITRQLEKAGSRLNRFA